MDLLDNQILILLGPVNVLTFFIIHSRAFRLHLAAKLLDEISREFLWNEILSEVLIFLKILSTLLSGVISEGGLLNSHQVVIHRGLPR